MIIYVICVFFVSLQQNVMNMALNLNKNLKLYYSISEVAQMFELNESTLRYWEQEFPSLKPKKLAAAKKILNQNRKGADKKADVLEALIGVRSELQALKKQLDFLQ